MKKTFPDESFLSRWDALFSGKLTEVDVQRIPFTYLGGSLHTFQPPPKNNSSYNETKHQNDMQKKFRQMAGSIDLVFYSGYTHELSQLPYKDDCWNHGETYRSLLHETQIRVGLSIESVQPLLRNDLTDSGMFLNCKKWVKTCKLIHWCDN